MTHWVMTSLDSSIHRPISARGMFPSITDQVNSISWRYQARDPSQMSAKKGKQQTRKKLSVLLRCLA